MYNKGSRHVGENKRENNNVQRRGGEKTKRRDIEQIQRKSTRTRSYMGREKEEIKIIILQHLSLSFVLQYKIDLTKDPPQ